MSIKNATKKRTVTIAIRVTERLSRWVEYLQYRLNDWDDREHLALASTLRVEAKEIEAAHKAKVEAAQKLLQVAKDNLAIAHKEANDSREQAKGLIKEAKSLEKYASLY